MAGFELWFAAGILLDELKKTEDAIEVYTEAIPLLDVAQEWPNATMARLRLGGAYLDLGGKENVERAVPVFARALEVAIKEHLDEVLPYAHSGLARSYEILGEFDKALTHYQAFIEKDRQIGGGIFTNTAHYGFLGTKANIYRHLGRYEESIEHFQAALRASRQLKQRKEEANILMMLAAVYFWIGDIDPAITYSKEALQFYRC
jgi:tetratricopeptide (TPR) repeat protein